MFPEVRPLSRPEMGGAKWQGERTRCVLDAVVRSGLGIKGESVFSLIPRLPAICVQSLVSADIKISFSCAARARQINTFSNSKN